MNDEKDNSLCPLCGKKNNCAIANGNDPGTCWCMTFEFTDGVRAEIDKLSHGSSCVCKECVIKISEELKKRNL